LADSSLIVTTVSFGSSLHPSFDWSLIGPSFAAGTQDIDPALHLWLKGFSACFHLGKDDKVNLSGRCQAVERRSLTSVKLRSDISSSAVVNIFVFMYGCFDALADDTRVVGFLNRS